MTTPIVLIAYPQAFACLAKFRRKVEKVLVNMENFHVVYQHDSRGFISETLSADPRTLSLECRDSLEGITHAIVFDDGEEFHELVSQLEQGGVKIRKIKIKITRVINIKRETQYANVKKTPSYEYIGRGSDWGNPYSMYDAGDEGMDSRDEVIRKYKYDFTRDLLKTKRAEAIRLSGKRLGCFCKPDACHGDVLAEYLNAFDDGE
jgi:hypothetical protein